MGSPNTLTKTNEEPKALSASVKSKFYIWDTIFMNAIVEAKEERTDKAVVTGDLKIPQFPNLVHSKPD